ncbi:MAG: phenylalanine--tRNA ligase subunit beta [Endomicrobium sp.]|jgi:phenylalanyl-tRNA synthetase beta chain|nr:phenylalanine--tRNA ligase subunit beta [Endomicrobium sp.]
MRLSYNWLKRFIDFDFNPQELASILTSIGIETSVVSSKCCWSGVVTAKVLDVQKHPYADKLYLCKVSDGLKDYSIICGAKNVSSGQVVPLAKIGAVLPGGIKIKKSKIRGIYSEGMICSKEELGLEKKSDGILILDKNTEVGVVLENALDEIDSVLEAEITLNRGDCLSYLGIAREIGAKIRKTLSIPAIKTFDVQDLNCIEVKSDLCRRYIGVLISGVKIGTSPLWIANVLEKSGIRPINNVVDAANYVMIELGQPLHVFDITKLESKKVVIRNAADCETIAALNGKEYKLDADMIVIADDKKPVAIAGVMGGEYSCIDEKTETVFLEIAIFDAGSIRKTSKKLNLSSDSSYRFERGLSWDIAEFASWRAANLIVELAGGLVKARKDLQTVKYERTNIVLRLERVSKILGYNVKEDEIAEILRFLSVDLQQKKGGIILCTIPSWRNDIKIEVDLVEEIARIKGYDNILPVVPSPEKHDACVYTSNNSFLPCIVEEFRNKLNGLGFSEVLNYSFLEAGELKKFNLEYFYKIANPLLKENEVLRPSLLPALYKNLLLNIGYGCERIALFEYGKIFTGSGEKKTFAVIMCGRVWQEWWKWVEQKISPKYDFYFGAGIVRNILPSDKFIIAENLNPKSYYHSGKTADIIYREKLVGEFGILNPAITDGIREEVFYFEIDLDSFDSVYGRENPIYKAYSRLPMVKRDISIVADKNLEFSKIDGIIRGVIRSGGILKEYSLFSMYSDGYKLGDNKISYSFRLFYKNDERTLTDEEVNEDINTLLGELYVKLGVKLRE